MLGWTPRSWRGTASFRRLYSRHSAQYLDVQAWYSCEGLSSTCASYTVCLFIQKCGAHGAADRALFRRIYFCCDRFWVGRFYIEQSGASTGVFQEQARGGKHVVDGLVCLPGNISKLLDEFLKRGPRLLTLECSRIVGMELI